MHKANLLWSIFISLFLLIQGSTLALETEELNWIVAGDEYGYIHSLCYIFLQQPTEIWKKKIANGRIDIVKIADIDNDGSKEIIAFSQDENIYSLDGETGDIEWIYSNPYKDFERYIGSFIEDIDNDQKPEIITSVKVNSPGNTHYVGPGGGVIVLEDDGTEKMKFDSPVEDGWNGNGPDGVEMDDFNGDGVKDLVFMAGGTLYPYSQPLIHVYDISGAFPAIIRDFNHHYTGSGMDDLEIADVNNDGQIDYMTAGWWCPAATFDSHGSLIWERNFFGGNADRFILYTANLDGSGNPALLVGTAAYNYASALYVYVVDPSNGIDIFTPITYPGNVRKFVPIAGKVADIDGDTINEILCWFQTENPSTDLLLSASGADGSVEWTREGIWNLYNAQLKDANGDEIFEIYIGDANMFICLDGNGNTNWQYNIESAWFSFDLSERIMKVDIDIKPGSDPNSINIGSNGNTPVAIFSTDAFDATNVNPTSISLAEASVKLRGKGTPMVSYEDVNGDGFPDIVVHVDTTALQLTGSDTEAVLEGKTFDGIKIRGVDAIRIIE